MDKHLLHTAPPAPELLKKICCTKKLVGSDAGLSQLGRKDALDIATYAKIITRPHETRRHTLLSPQRTIASVSGTIRALVLLVDFSDNQANEEPIHFKKMLFSSNEYGGGSLRDYYEEVSYGKLDVVGDVFGWYRAPQPYSYYADGEYGFGGPPKNAQQLVKDVVELADTDVDFSQYDLNNDGEVDALFIVHAGHGAEETSNVNDIWSHRWGINAVFKDGVRISGYTMEPENGNIGVFCHELGHNFDLPDLYDTDYNSHGIGRWCLMAGGAWNNHGKSPAHMSAWCKYKLGWMEPDEILDGGRSVSLRSSALNVSDNALKLPVGDPAGKEYFLIENRAHDGFDEWLPGAGLLIWHIDENQSNNTDQNHYLVALEQADGLLELETNNSDNGDSGDPYPGQEGNRNFTASSNPNSGAYDGTSSNVYVTNISDPSASMDFDVYVGVPPVVSVLGSLPCKDIEGVGSMVAKKLAGVGIATVAQLAVVDVLEKANETGLNDLKLFDYKARAQLVAHFELDDMSPFSAIGDLKLADILSQPRGQLAQTSAQPMESIDLLKDKLALLSSALDISTIKSLTLAQIG
jgi:immune inhibitor A